MWELTLVGLGIGLLVGVIGMGGGSLMTPILVLGFDFPPVTAVGTDIFHGAIFKTIGAWRHRVLGHVHARLAFWFALGSIPASIAGVALVEVLQRRYGDDIDDVATIVLEAALVLAAVGLLPRRSFSARQATTARTCSPDAIESWPCRSASSAGMAHVVGGNVDLGATAWLALGSIPGILVGSQLTVRLPETAIRLALGVVLFVSGLKLVGVF